MDSKSINKCYSLFNEIFDNQIKKYESLINENEKIPKECAILLTSANSTINKCFCLIEDDDYINSLCLLRSAFELIMFSLAIGINEKTYKVYTYYNKENYHYVLNKKYEKEKNKNPKFKAPNKNKKKDELSPASIRYIVASHYEDIFKELFYYCKTTQEVNKELSQFYSYLCDFTHPSIIKTYVYKIQSDEDKLKHIKTIFKLNINYCKMLLLCALNFYTLKDLTDDLLDLYAIIFMLDISTIDDVSNMNKLLKKYDEYLYLDNTKAYFCRDKKKLNAMKKDIEEIKKCDNPSEILSSTMIRVIEHFNSKDLINKYFNN